jgi:hypothetical protein
MGLSANQTAPFSCSSNGCSGPVYQPWMALHRTRSKKKKIMDRKRSIFIVELSLFDCIGKKWVERHGDVNDHGRNIVEPHDI